MSGKDALIDFASYVVALLSFAFVIFFIILGDRFEPIMRFFISIIPFAIFSLIAVVILNIRKREIKKKKDDSNYDLTLFLNYGDRLTSDMLFTGLPLLVMLVGFLMKWSIQKDDVMQASIVFIVLYIYFKALYRKAG
ncbi:MAG: hypothetical protein PF572_03735 [Patescibacteria group bacterium]|jgi:membrane protein implicated in regulation of membrane protease activity|nr:hypothetical protein [Patescibacteria group bacterium]